MFNTVINLFIHKFYVSIDFENERVNVQQNCESTFQNIIEFGKKNRSANYN